MLATDAFGRRRRRAWLLDLHRWLGGLAIAFVSAHLAALMADNYTHFDLADLTIPYASEWHPGAVALGVIAAWALLAVELTSLAMRRLPRALWRAIHLTSYLTFWLVSMHAAFAGSDRPNRLYQLTASASVAALVWATLYRLMKPRNHRRRPSPPTGTGSRTTVPAIVKEGC